MPSIFNLPITKDGNTTGTEQYSLVGLLCHSGEAHKKGHYFAVYVWIVDDGSFPGPEDADCSGVGYPFPMDVPCDFPTVEPPQCEDRPAKRQCQDTIPFTFVNVTSLGPEVRQWLLCRPRTPIFVAHLAEDDFQKTQQWFATRGFGVLGHPAATSPKGGTNGGLLVFCVKRSLLLGKAEQDLDVLLIMVGPKHVKEELESFQGDFCLTMPIVCKVPTKLLQVLELALIPAATMEVLLQPDFNLSRECLSALPP